jgi:hypothetical protein
MMIALVVSILKCLKCWHLRTWTLRLKHFFSHILLLQLAKVDDEAISIV